MYTVINTTTLQEVESNSDSKALLGKYDMKKHVIVKGGYTRPDVKERTPTVIPITVHMAEFDFSTLSKKDKSLLKNLYKDNRVDQIRELLNKHKIGHICCAGQYPVMLEQIKKSIENGIL